MSKPFSHMNREEITAAVDDKKALPDMILKRIIFDAQAKMNQAEAKLIYTRLKSGGFTNGLDVYHLRVNILECWRLISEMSREKNLLNLNNTKTREVTDYDLMKRLYSKEPVSESTMHHLVEYANYCLHELNLTNLLFTDNVYHPDEETY